MTDRARREMLGDFLRTRRERLAPESIGVAVEPRRRSPGLRREEVARLAHLSTSWYTYLEQGRDVRPSVEVLDNVARALRLETTEHRYLNALAAGPARTVAAPLALTADETVALHQLIRSTDALPLPVYAMDGRGNVLACNTAMPEWYGSAWGEPGCSVNMIRWLFTDPDARLRLTDWHTDARDLVSRVRYYFGTNGYDAEAERLVGEIRAADPVVDGWWREHNVSAQESRERVFAHPEFGRTPLTLSVLRPAVSPAASVIFHLPR